MPPYRYRRIERHPVEVLVFETDPAHVEEFLAVDHEVWTLGEAEMGHTEQIPFLSKEVWLDDAHPGRITLIFVWESMSAWLDVADPAVQEQLQSRFDARFTHPYRLVRALHEESDNGIYRWSRFERLTPTQD
jgi:uncharacterized protein (TIGR03792 family)